MSGSALGRLFFLVAATLALSVACGGDTENAVADPYVAAIEALSVPSELADGLTLGSADADVTIEMFEDYQCPFCLRFTADQEHFLVSELVEGGEVLLVFRNFPILGAESVAAAVGAYCAGEQNEFWDFHRELFLIQVKAGQLDDEKLNIGRFSDEILSEIADGIGIDDSQWDECYASEEALEAVADDVRAARAAGLTGTPGFLVNGQALPGAPRDSDVWNQIIEAAKGD